MRGYIMLVLGAVLIYAALAGHSNAVWQSVTGLAVPQGTSGSGDIVP